MEIKPASEVTIDQIVACSNAAFADYFGHPIVFTPESFAAFVDGHGGSLARSYVMYDADKDAVVGFLLMGYRADLPLHARVVAMGVVPDCVGQRVGSRLLSGAVDAARADGLKFMWLEVIQENAAGIRLYTRRGFQKATPLQGWEKDDSSSSASSPPGGTSHQLQESTPEEVLSMVKAHTADDAPWQLWHQFSLTTRPQNSRTFKLGSAYCSVSDPEAEGDEPAALQALVVEPSARGKGQATALLKALLEKYPGKKWRVGPLIPPAYGESIAKKLGCTLANLSMDLMRLDIE